MAEAQHVGRADATNVVFEDHLVFYVYVLRSLRNHKRYVGYTAKPPPEKLAEHNAGATRWTRQNRPFELIYHEVFDDSKSARKRELFLKSGKGRELLDELFRA